MLFSLELVVILFRIRSWLEFKEVQEVRVEAQWIIRVILLWKSQRLTLFVVHFIHLICVIVNNLARDINWLPLLVVEAFVAYGPGLGNDEETALLHTHPFVEMVRCAAAYWPHLGWVIYLLCRLSHG